MQMGYKSGANRVQIRCKSGANQVQIECKSSANRCKSCANRLQNEVKFECKVNIPESCKWNSKKRGRKAFEHQQQQQKKNSGDETDDDNEDVSESRLLLEKSCFGLLHVFQNVLIYSGRNEIHA